MGAYDEEVGAGLDPAMTDPGRQQCDITGGHLNLLRAPSAQQQPR
jgi:hypothetical protein